MMLSVGLVAAGVGVAFGFSKRVGDMGDMSVDATGSRLGLVLAATGVALMVATLATAPQRLLLTGAAVSIAATFVAGWLMISTPTGVARTTAYPVAHETTCRPAAVIHAVAQSSGLTRNSGHDVLSKCRSVSRTRVGIGAAGALAMWVSALVWLRRKPVDIEKHLASALPQ